MPGAKHDYKGQVREAFFSPTTIAASQQNVKGAHCQCAIWRKVLQDLPRFDLTFSHYSQFDGRNKKPCPNYALKLVRYSCASEASACKNPQTKVIVDFQDTEKLSVDS